MKTEIPRAEGQYLRARDKGVEATRLGRLHEARDHFAEACEAAQACGEPLIDRAFCSLAAIEIEIGEGIDALIPRLREILTKNSDNENCRLAAYHLARAYDLRKEYKKALFYARVARERSERSGQTSWIASSCNQMGTLLLAESRFDEARSELDRALLLMTRGGDSEIHRGLVQGNLGYCLLVQERFEEGFSHLFQGLRTIRRQKAEAWSCLFHLSLCYGYLEIGRLRPAARHGCLALELAEAHGDIQTAKNSLFLLGEVANLSGDVERAHSYFHRLQERYFPEHDFLPDFLVAIDVRSLVNLKA